MRLDNDTDASAVAPGETISLLLSRAAVARKNGKHQKAATLLRKAARLNPEDRELQLAAAEALRKIGGVKEMQLGPITDCEKEIGKIRRLRKAGQAEAAEARCRRILETQPHHVNASIELALLLRRAENEAAALEQLEKAQISSPDNPELLLELAHVLRGLRRYDEARKTLQAVLELQPGNVAALHGLAKLEQRIGEWKAALAAYENLVALKSDDPNIFVEIATVQFEMVRYEEAEATLALADEIAGEAGNERYLARKFQYFCVTGQWDRAQECLEQWPDHRAVPRGALSDVVRFYAERDRWHDVVDFLRERVVSGWSGKRNGDTLLDALAGGIRHTGRYAEALEMLDRWPAEDSAAVRNLREQIAEEISLLETVGLQDSVQHRHEPHVVTNPIRIERRALLRRAFSGGPQVQRNEPGTTDTIYICADAKYILGAAVSLFSLLRHNQEPARNCNFVVYCPPGLLEFATTAFGDIADGMGAEIDVRSSATLVCDEIAFRTKWGAFTLGRGLSIAAYYRIFAALQLLRENRSGRALYIDADTCVGPGLEALLRFNLKGLPIAVRREDPDGPGVLRACARLGVARGEYFNSGVLLFDLVHPELEMALDRSIAFAIEKQHLLTMVDQCALNVGFKGNAASLSPEFNFFIRDSERLEIPSEVPVVTHYTAHPKPWDPSYQSRHCLRWFEEFEALGRVLAPAHMKQLYAYSFPQRHGGWKGKDMLSGTRALHDRIVQSPAGIGTA
jgi:lipopolysaccharide biosynthesis glycosyltransferase/Flp pilus assembly protein TadD